MGWAGCLPPGAMPRPPPPRTIRSVELFPDYGAAHYALALVYRALGDGERYRQQFRWYEQNRTSVPPLDDPLRGAVARLNMGSVAHIRRGADLARAGKIDEAIQEQQDALRVDPKAVQAHINLIALYGRLGQYESAAEHYRAALDLDRNQADLHYNYGVLLLKKRRPEEAERAFRAALEINPYYADAHDNLGVLSEQQGRLNDAVRHFEEAVENRPNDRAAHFHLGRLLANRAEYDEAIQHFLKTLTPEDESTPRYLYALAATYARAGNSRRSTEIRPHRPGAGSGSRSGRVAGQHREGLSSSGETVTTAERHEQAPRLPGAHARCFQHCQRRPLRCSATSLQTWA